MADTRDAPTRQDTWHIHFAFDGDDYGVWDKKTGGEVDSDETKFNPGNMQSPISLGGKPTVGNLTLQRLYDRDSDHARIIGLMNGAGKKPCVVTVRPLDFDGNPAGKQAVMYNGLLKRVSMPDVDSEGTGAALLEIEVTVNGMPAYL